MKLDAFLRGERKIYSQNNYVSGKRQVPQFSDYDTAKQEARSLTRRLEVGQIIVLEAPIKKAEPA